MIRLNAGNIWDNDYLDKVIEWNEEFKDSIEVRSLFGSIAKLTPTARAVDRLPYRDWDFLEKYIRRAKDHQIATRYTLNQSCIGPMQDFRREWDTNLEYNLVVLHDLGICEWTVTSPLLVELLRKKFPDDFIEVSTIAEVSTPEDARRWRELGANGVNLSTNINRDFLAISEIVKTGLEISLLANEACLYRCPWRRECYNLSSHNSLRSEDLFGFYPFRRCNEARLARPEEWISSRLILPQWMRVYQELTGIRWFKVAYRTHPIEVALPILRAYMGQKFSGNLCDLWPTIAQLGKTPEPREVTHISCEKLDSLEVLSYFIDHGGSCDKYVCGVTCKYCGKIYQETQK